MATRIRPVEYFYATVKHRPAAAYKLLSDLAAAEVDLLAFNAIPMGPEVTQLVLFPADVGLLRRAAELIDVNLTGPHQAFLIQGDDELGVLARIHGRLSDLDIAVYASAGVTDGRGGYGYVVYVRPEDFARAAKELGEHIE